MPELAPTFLGVDSHLELYTTVFGWTQYNNLWEILTDTGLVFLPFFGLLMQAFTETMTSQQTTSASFTSLRRIEIDLIMMMSVVILAGQPLIPVQTQQLTFVQMCQHDGVNFTNKKITLDNDSSGYRNATFSTTQLKDKDGNPTNHDRSKIPVWWFAVMSISSGITHAAKTAIPCVKDFRSMHTAMNTLRIDDPLLRSELREFILECYVPALDYYTMRKHEIEGRSTHDNVVQKILAEYGNDYNKIEEIPTTHLRWIGAQLFLELPGPHFYSGRFLSDKLVIKEKGGYYAPSCRDLWLGRDDKALGVEIDGLFPRLKQIILNDSRPIVDLFFEAVTAQYDKRPFRDGGAKGIKADEAKTDDSVMELILMHWIPVNLNRSRHQDLYKSINREKRWLSFETIFGNVGGFIGTISEWIERWPMIHIVQEAAPLVISLILMSIYMLLPLGLVFSSYSFEFVLYAAVGIFAVKFLSYFWHIAWWLDQNLLQISGLDTEDWFTEMLMAMTVTTMYFLTPLVFFAMLSWANYHIANEIQDAYEQMGGEGSAVAEAGRAGIRFVKELIDTALMVAATFLSGGWALAAKFGRAGMRLFR